MNPRMICLRDAEAVINEYGFLPLFRCEIPGFSVEDMTPEDHWFKEGVEGPWDWREAIAAKGEIAYAKVFHGKAGFISPDWYADFANFRRDGYDFDARADEGLCPNGDRKLMAMIERGVCLSGELRAQYPGKGVDGALTRLQMQTYLTIERFDYKRAKDGHSYGWGSARYAIPEVIFGLDRVRGAYEQNPRESHEKLIDRLRTLRPSIGREAAEAFFSM